LITPGRTDVSPSQSVRKRFVDLITPGRTDVSPSQSVRKRFVERALSFEPLRVHC